GDAFEVERDMADTDERLDLERAADRQAIGDFAEHLDIVALDLAPHGLVDRAERGLAAGLAFGPAELHARADRKPRHEVVADPADREGNLAVLERRGSRFLVEQTEPGRGVEAAGAVPEAARDTVAAELDAARAVAAVDAVVEAGGPCIG